MLKEKKEKQTILCGFSVEGNAKTYVVRAQRSLCNHCQAIRYIEWHRIYAPKSRRASESNSIWRTWQWIWCVPHFSCPLFVWSLSLETRISRGATCTILGLNEMHYTLIENDCTMYTYSVHKKCLCIHERPNGSYCDTLDTHTHNGCHQRQWHSHCVNFS